MIPPETGNLATSAGPDALVEIERVVDHMWSVHPHVPDPVRTQMGIAVSEIGANIIEHAAAGQPVRMWMQMKVLSNEVWVEFQDEGLPLRVDLDAVRLPDDFAERGRGLALAQAVLDRLSYERNSVNHWTLVKLF